MRTETVEYKLYKYDELSDKAKEKALEGFYDFNVDYEWWDSSYDWFQEKLKEVGLKCKTFYFGLDRDRFLEAVDLEFIDVAKFIETSVQAGVKKSILDVADLTINYTRGYRHTFHTIDTYRGIPDRCPRLNKYLTSLIDRCNDKLGDMFSDFLSQLEEEYDYLTSREAIEESIRCNEYEFLEHGEFYR